ncbi:flagellar hook-length control protein FliK [Fuscovulum blasticum]|uniref:flagellar hook-length control protein FliK n=1 Tax=Fuscovulum blasticum TaxID=1075 RepID=UPI0013E07A68|nr:flagellar hook-length control protein FliK [Fuscovulum blasticum]
MFDPPDPAPGLAGLEADVPPISAARMVQETPADGPVLPPRPAANGDAGTDSDGAANVQLSVIPFASPAAASSGAPVVRPEPAPLRPAIGEPAALRDHPVGFPADLPFAQILSPPFRAVPVRAVPVHPADALAAAAPETAPAPEVAETRAARSGDGATAPAPPGALGGPPQAGASVAAAQIVGAVSAPPPGPALAGEGEGGPARDPLSEGADAPLPAAAPLPRKVVEGGAAAALPADPASAPGHVADTGAGLTDAPGPTGAPAPPHAGLSPPHIPAGPPAAAPLPAAVPAQIVQAATDSGSPVTEIRLSPEELGSLRIELRTEGDRAFVTLSAERADTLDLLRRHSDRLAADFRAAGFAQVDLGFGHWSGPGQGADQAAPAPDGPMLPEAPPPDPAAWPSPVSPPAGAGLYLRL